MSYASGVGGKIVVTTTGQVATLTITGGGGSSYTTGDKLVFNGACSRPARATLTIAGGIITATTLLDGGAGYLVAPTTTITSSTGGTSTGSGGGVTTTLSTVQTTLDNQEWEIDEDPRQGETTNANTGGGTDWVGGPTEQSGSFSVVWDSSATPESIGLIANNIATVVLYQGSTGKTYTGQVLLGKKTHKVNNKDGSPIIYTFAFKVKGLLTAA